MIGIRWYLALKSSEFLKFSGLLPEIQNYIILHFILPFEIAKRELETIEPYYKIFGERLGISEHAVSIFGENLVLDERINNGRHEKYRKVLISLFTCQPTGENYPSSVQFLLTQDDLQAYCVYLRLYEKENWPEATKFIQKFVQLSNDNGLQWEQHMKESLLDATRYPYLREYDFVISSSRRLLLEAKKIQI